MAGSFQQNNAILQGRVQHIDVHGLITDRRIAVALSYQKGGADPAVQHVCVDLPFIGCDSIPARAVVRTSGIRLVYAVHQVQQSLQGRLAALGAYGPRLIRILGRGLARAHGLLHGILQHQLSFHGVVHHIGNPGHNPLRIKKMPYIVRTRVGAGIRQVTLDHFRVIRRVFQLLKGDNVARADKNHAIGIFLVKNGVHGRFCLRLVIVPHRGGDILHIDPIINAIKRTFRIRLFMMVVQFHQEVQHGVTIGSVFLSQSGFIGDKHDFHELFSNRRMAVSCRVPADALIIQAQEQRVPSLHRHGPPL